MTLNLPLLYFVWTEEYCQTSPNKNKSPNRWQVTKILVCCIFEHHWNNLGRDSYTETISKKQVFDYPPWTHHVVRKAVVTSPLKTGSWQNWNYLQTLLNIEYMCTQNKIINIYFEKLDIVHQVFLLQLETKQPKQHCSTLWTL